MCPDAHSSDKTYALGNLVAQPGSPASGVFECQGEQCNSSPPATGSPGWFLVGTCVSEAATQPTQGTGTQATAPPPPASDGTMYWFPSAIDGVSACAYGQNYPAVWLASPDLKSKFLFGTEDGCCAAFPSVCGAFYVAPGSTPAPFTLSPTVAPPRPTASPSEAGSTVFPTATEGELSAAFGRAGGLVAMVGTAAVGVLVAALF